MSLDLDKINGLLNIVKEAAGHPTKLAALGALAMKELEGHNAEAKKAHDEIAKAQNAEAAKKRQAELDKQAKALAEEQRKAHLTSQPQEVKKPLPVARAADEFEPEPDTTEPVSRRNVTEEVTNG